MKKSTRAEWAAILHRLGAWWIVVYLACGSTFWYSFYTDMSSGVPFGFARDPRYMYIFIATYLFFVTYMLSPRAIAEHDDAYRYAVVRQVLPVMVIFDGCTVGVFLYCFLVYQEQFVIIFMVALQGIVYIETALVLLIEGLDKGAVEVFLSVETNTLDQNAQVDCTAPGAGMVGIALYVVGMAAMVFAASVPYTAVQNRAGLFIFQALFVMWTHHAGICLVSGWTAVSCVMKLTTIPSQSRRAHLLRVLRASLKYLGVFCYLGSVGVLFSGLAGLKTVLFFDRWKTQHQEAVEAVFKRYCPSLFFYYGYRVETIAAATVLFDSAPHKALAKLHVLTAQSDTPVYRGLTHIASDNTTKTLSRGAIVVLLVPVAVAWWLINLKLGMELDSLRLSCLLGWCTYATPAIEYIYTETIHRALLLASLSSVPIDVPWVAGHLSGLQM